MSAPVRTRRLYGPVLLAANESTPHWTVPAGRTALIKQVTVVRAAAVTNTLTLWVGNEQGAVPYWQTQITTPVGQAFAVQLVVHPLETVWLQNVSTGALWVALGGALLDGAPA